MKGQKNWSPGGMNSLSTSPEMGQDYCHPLLQVAFQYGTTVTFLYSKQNRIDLNSQQDGFQILWLI